MKGSLKSNIPDVLPDGQTFLFRIISALDGATKEQQIPKVDLRVTVESDGPSCGKKLNHTVLLYPSDHKHSWITEQFLAAMETPRDSTGEYEYDTANWKGKMFNATVKNEEYRGQQQSKLRNVSKLTDEQKAADEAAPF